MSVPTSCLLPGERRRYPPPPTRPATLVGWSVPRRSCSRSRTGPPRSTPSWGAGRATRLPTSSKARRRRGRDGTGNVGRTGHRGARSTRRGPPGSSTIVPAPHPITAAGVGSRGGGVGGCVGAGPASEASRAQRSGCHQRGVTPPLVDPARLVARPRPPPRVGAGARDGASSRPTSPFAGGRVAPLEDQTQLALGGRELRVLATPGHASTIFALTLADTGAGRTERGPRGSTWTDITVLRPATVLSEFDLERYGNSIDADP